LELDYYKKFIQKNEYNNYCKTCPILIINPQIYIYIVLNYNDTE